MSIADIEMVFDENLNASSVTLTMHLEHNEIFPILKKFLLAYIQRKPFRWIYTFTHLSLNGERLK